MCPREQIVSNTIKMQKTEKKDQLHIKSITYYISITYLKSITYSRNFHATYYYNISNHENEQVLHSCVSCQFAFKSMTEKILFILQGTLSRVNVLHFLRSMNPRVLDIMIRENVQLKNKVLQILPVILKRIQVSVFVFCSYVFTHASNCSTIFLPELMNFYLFLTKLSSIKSVVITYDVQYDFFQLT